MLQPTTALAAATLVPAALVAAALAVLYVPDDHAVLAARAAPPLQASFCCYCSVTSSQC